MEGGPLLSRSVARQLAARDQSEAKQPDTPKQHNERVGFAYRRGCHCPVVNNGVSPPLASRLLIDTAVRTLRPAGSDGRRWRSCCAGGRSWWSRARPWSLGGRNQAAAAEPFWSSSAPLFGP